MWSLREVEVEALTKKDLFIRLNTLEGIVEGFSKLEKAEHHFWCPLTY